MTELEGYRRQDKRVGIRNDVAIIYTASCSQLVAKKISATLQATQVFGPLTDFYRPPALVDKFVALGQHPNIASVLVVGLDSEAMDAAELANRIAASGKDARYLKISEFGGTQNTIERGIEIAGELVSRATEMKRESLSFSDLVVAMDCSGSDATSGLGSNPAAGAASDLLVQSGATVYCFNVEQELIGMESEYCSRAANEAVRNQLRSRIPDTLAPPPTAENTRGGISTAKEKAVGALAKAGSSPLSGVVEGFQRPSSPGLYLQIPVESSYEDLSGPQCVMQMAAAGAHIVVETTGAGLVAGGVVASPIKVCANPKTCLALNDEIDIDASGSITGDASIEEVGQSIFRKVIAVAKGDRTRAELLGHYES